MGWLRRRTIRFAVLLLLSMVIAYTAHRMRNPCRQRVRSVHAAQEIGNSIGFDPCAGGFIDVELSFPEKIGDCSVFIFGVAFLGAFAADTLWWCRFGSKRAV